MFSGKPFAATFGAAAMALQPQIAAAQAAECVTESEVSSMAVYAVPGLIESMRLRCGPSLSTEGFLALDGGNLINRYAAAQDRVWPLAKSGFIKIISSKKNTGSGEFDILAQLPDDAVRPLVEALLIQKVTEKIEQKDCRKFERVMEAIAPIEPDVAGNLIGVITGLANVRNPSICLAEPEEPA